jgi:hypothetical protein
VVKSLGTQDNGSVMENEEAERVGTRLKKRAVPGRSLL